MRGWSSLIDVIDLYVWERIVRESTLIQRRKHEEKWAAYESGLINPRVLTRHTNHVRALAVGIGGKIYSGSWDSTIRVWSGADGTLADTHRGLAVAGSQ